MYLCSKVSQHERKMHLSHPLRALHKCAFGNYLVQVSKLKLLNRFLGSSRPFLIVNCLSNFPPFEPFWASIIKKNVIAMFVQEICWIYKQKQNSTYNVEKFKFKSSSKQLLTDPDLGVKEIVLLQLSCLFSLNLFHLTRCELFRENKF